MDGSGSVPFVTLARTMPGSMRWSAPWLAAALALSAATARAQPAESRQIALEYQVDPSLSGCPTEADLSRAIRERLGYDPFVVGAAASASQRVKAAIERGGAGATSSTSARFEWLDRAGHSEGERRLGSEGDDCAELGRGLAFAIAVQIQLRASTEPTAAAPPPATPPPRPPAVAHPAATPRRAPKRSTVVVAGAGALGQQGLTPGVSAGVRIFGSLGTSRASLELSTEAGSATERRAADGTGFSARALNGKLAPCAHFGPVGLCGVGMLGLLSVRGEGVDRIETPSSLVGGAGARLQLLWPTGSPFAGLVHAEAVVLFTPRTVSVNRDDVWSTAPVVFSAGLDLAAVFR
jgi:hypothetical protein